MWIFFNKNQSVVWRHTSPELIRTLRGLKSKVRFLKIFEVKSIKTLWSSRSWVKRENRLWSMLTTHQFLQLQWRRPSVTASLTSVFWSVPAVVKDVQVKRRWGYTLEKNIGSLRSALMCKTMRECLHLSLLWRIPSIFGLRTTRRIDVIPGNHAETSSAGWKQRLRTKNMQQQVNATIVGRMSMIANVVPDLLEDKQS